MLEWIKDQSAQHFQRGQGRVLDLEKKTAIWVCFENFTYVIVDSNVTPMFKKNSPNSFPFDYLSIHDYLDILMQ